MWVHDLSPFILKFPETSLWGDQFGLRWYGFSYMLGFICAYFLIRWLAERQRAGLTAPMVGDFVTYVAIGILAGGRLGYCLFYDTSLFFSFRPTVPFWGVLAVNEGGMASHGGILGIIVASFIFGKKYGINYAYLLDLASITAPIGVFFGRIANFINGELVGRITESTNPFAVKFPSDILNWPNYEFGRLTTLEPIVEKVGVTSSQWSEWLQNFNVDGGARDALYSTLFKVVHAIQSGQEGLKEMIAPVLDPRHPSQLYAAFGEGLLIFVVLFFLARKARRPGFIAGSCVVLYSIVRIIDEQFRTPDAHIGYQLFDLTRGQWLSIGMLVAGILLLFYWSRTQSQTVYGWLRGESVKFGRSK